MWTHDQAVELANRCIRVNCSSPGPTDTPMMPAFERVAPSTVVDVLTFPTGRRSTPNEQADALLFLNSAAAGPLALLARSCRSAG